MKVINTIGIATLCTLCLFSSQANGADAYQAEELGIAYGHGTDISKWVQMDMLIPAQIPVQPVAHIIENLALESFINFAFGMSKWESSSFIAYHFSSSLLLRTQHFNTPLGNIFFEGAFGPHLISKPGKTSRLDTAFEFHSHLGVGLALSPQWTITSKIDHLSNGGLTQGNAGVNAYMVQLHYRFDDKD